MVAIAGTNYNSIFDVLIEDFFVGSQVAWAYGHPPAGTTPKISAGTFTGLTLLQFMTPGPGMPGANQPLRGVPRPPRATRPIDVITTGHSLGGALAPALALWLLDTQTAWDPQGRATIYCEPSAGPTSGNDDFATYYELMLGLRTTRIVNSLDMVPHAWNAADLIVACRRCTSRDIEPDLVVYALAAAAAVASSGGDYTQINGSTPPLTGTIDTSLINPAVARLREFPGPGRPAAHQRVLHVDGRHHQHRGDDGGHAGDGASGGGRGRGAPARAGSCGVQAIPAEAGS